MRVVVRRSQRDSNTSRVDGVEKSPPSDTFDQRTVRIGTIVQNNIYKVFYKIRFEKDGECPLSEPEEAQASARS